MERHYRDATNEPGDSVDAVARAVVDCAFAVHVTLGPGYGEAVYDNALCVELALRSIPFVRQPITSIEYKGLVVGECRLDLVVADLLVVELKSVSALEPVHIAQLLAYLKATRRELGLLINFNVARIKDGLRRVVLHHPQNLGALATWRPGDPSPR